MPRALAGATRRGNGRIPGTRGRQMRGAPRRIGGFMTSVPRQPTSTIFRQAHFQQVRDVRGRFAGGWGFAWIGLEAASQALQDMNDRIHSAIHEAADQLGQDMVAYAKENAPWLDHPGEHEDARDNLQYEVVWSDEENFTIFLGHGKNVYYGIWLEVRWGGRYAILLPTIELFAPQLAGRVKAFV